MLMKSEKRSEQDPAGTTRVDHGTVEVQRRSGTKHG